MSSNRKFKLEDYSVTATTAGVYLPGGDFLEVSNLSGAVVVEFLDGSQIIGEASISADREFDFRNDPSMKSRAFTRVRIYTASGTQTCIATIGEGASSKSKAYAATTTPQAAANHTETTRYQKTAGQTETIAARSGRRLLVIQNLPTSAGGIWTGGAANKGVYLVPGADTDELYRDYSGAVTIYSVSTADVAVEEIY